MFGYVIPDKPNMFMKDYYLYKAFYCGMCKTIGKKCGQLMRFSTNYDITFLDILAHAVFDKEIVLSNEVCILNPIVKKSIVKTDDLSIKVMHINNILMHYKCVDDVIDNKSKSKKFVDKVILKKHYIEAKAEFPLIDKLVGDGYKELRVLEKENCGFIEKVSDKFAIIMQNIGENLLGDKFNEDLSNILYNLGKWIYIADAVEDIDDDYKDKKYNMWLVDYDYKDKKTFLDDKGCIVEEYLMACYNSIANSFGKLEISKYEGVLANILWYGVLEATKQIIRRTKKCKKTRI